MSSRSEIIEYISDPINKLFVVPEKHCKFNHITGIIELSEKDYNEYNK